MVASLGEKIVTDRQECAFPAEIAEFGQALISENTAGRLWRDSRQMLAPKLGIFLRIPVGLTADPNPSVESAAVNLNRNSICPLK